MFVGIDNGINGGIVVINEAGSAIAKYSIPKEKFQATKTKIRTRVDAKKLAELIESIIYKHQPTHWFLESALIMSAGIQAVASTWYTYGLHRGILESLGQQVDVIQVRDWQKFIGKKAKDDSKQVSLDFAVANSDQPLTWFIPPKCRVPHDGFTDAYGIALYGSSKLF